MASRKKKESKELGLTSSDLSKFQKEWEENERRNVPKFGVPKDTLEKLSPSERAEIWLNHVSGAINTYNYQEAVIYLISRGYSCKEQVKSILLRWKQEEHKAYDVIEYWSGLRRSRKQTSKRKIEEERKKIIENLSETTTFDLPHFWELNNHDLLIDVTDSIMFRTVEWCGIGGFDEWWERYAKELKNQVISDGFDIKYDAISANRVSFFLFNMCRSGYAFDLMHSALERYLEAMELPEKSNAFPWRRTDLKESPPMTNDYYEYASSIAFCNSILRKQESNMELVEKALNFLQKNQLQNGAWATDSRQKSGSILSTAIAIHAFCINKPRGWEITVSRAVEWLLSMQDNEGYWFEYNSQSVVYLTVLVLDAIELANGGLKTTIRALTQESKRTETKTKSSIHIEKGEVIMGDKYVAGDNIGGIQNIGNFDNVVNNLNTNGQSEIADCLTTLKNAIISSQDLTNEKKNEHIDVLKTLGEEVSKPQPNKTMIKMLGDGLLVGLKVVPDVAKAATALAPLLAQLIK